MVMWQQPSLVERVVSPIEAESRILSALNELDLRPVLKELDVSNGLAAFCCFLECLDGTRTIDGAGAGKGNRLEAKVGALFESLEHLITGPEFFDQSSVKLQSVSSIAGSRLAIDASISLLPVDSDQKIACYEYDNLLNDEQITIPVYLSSPWYVEEQSSDIRRQAGDDFNYYDLARYSTNSGSAIGVNSEEATVHALNEVIERDAFSLLLIRSFFGKAKSPKIVQRQTLPSELVELLSYVERRLGKSVLLLDITTDVKVPAYLAYVPESPFRYGSGASLSSYYAAYRALSELLQVFLLEENKLAPDPLTSLRSLQKYPALYRCGIFDLTSILPESRFVAFASGSVPRDIEGHIREILARLTRAGFSAYQRKVYSLENGITVVHVFIPGMERFGIVASGLPVMPGNRGMEAVRKIKD